MTYMTVTSNINQLIFVLLSAYLCSCSVARQIGEAKRFARCEFRMTTVKNLELGGVDIQHVRSIKDLNLGRAAKLTAALTEKTLPLSFDLNLEATNPNDKPAAMNRLEWRLFIDGREFVAGTLDHRIDVAPQSSTEFPVGIQVDLKEILRGESRDAILKLAFNLVGEGDRPSNVLLKIKPTVVVAGIEVDYPGYFDAKAKVDAQTMKGELK